MDNINYKTELLFSYCNFSCDDCSMITIINCSKIFNFTENNKFYVNGVNFYNQNENSIEIMLDFFMENKTLMLFKLFIYNSSFTIDTNITKYRNLKIIHIEKCQYLNKITKNIFSKLKYLIHLNLRENSIREIDENAFKELKFIEFLDLSSNKFYFINENHFLNLSYLKTLIIENLHIKYFDKNSFTYLINLKILFIKKTKILSLKKLHANLFKNTKNLKNVVNDYLGICCLIKKFHKLTKCEPKETIYLFCGYLINSILLKC